VLWFPLPVAIPPTAPHSLITISSALYSLDTEKVKKKKKRIKGDAITATGHEGP
jgi:hypothetical protein